MEKIGLDVFCAYFQYKLRLLDISTGLSLPVHGIYSNGIIKADTMSISKEAIGIKYKFMLIPLEELTEEHAKELGFKTTSKLRQAINNGTLNYNQFDNLASQHYDLFGLFEDGLAVRK